MLRTAKAFEAGMIYRVLSRGNGHMYLFEKDEKDEKEDAFEENKGDNQ